MKIPKQLESGQYYYHCRDVDGGLYCRRILDTRYSKDLDSNMIRWCNVSINKKETKEHIREVNIGGKTYYRGEYILTQNGNNGWMKESSFRQWVSRSPHYYLGGYPDNYYDVASDGSFRIRDHYKFECPKCGCSQNAKPSMAMSTGMMKSGSGSCLKCNTDVHLEIHKDNKKMIATSMREYLDTLNI